jgi:uncharacterized damage-inducible protein DinB
MNWTELLNGNIEYTYGSTQKLLDLVDDDKLGWKPATGSNWMTMGQLAKHLTEACGAPCRGFVTGDWGIPAGSDPDNMPSDQMLPPAERLPTITSAAEAKRLLEQDKKLALAMVAQAGEDNLANKVATAPWDKMQMKLGNRVLQMIGHLNQHKGQLYYYLKLQGKPVNTMHLWGM